MITNGKALFDFIDGLLNKEGFIKKKDTWYKHSYECISFFTIGKSPYGGYYDHAFGFFLKDIETEKEYPVYYKCDLKISLQNFVDKDLVRRVLNLEDQSFVDMKREDILSQLLEVHVIPFLKSVSTKKGIKSVIEDYPDLIHYMNADARQYLKLEGRQSS